MTEIETLRAENYQLQAECTRLRGRLERCQHRAAEIVRCWNEYHQLSVLKDRLGLTQRPPARKTRNGHSSARHS
jgi:hypothetical protein